MIARDDYAGPITKSAEAMFARAGRKARLADPAARGHGGMRPRPPSPMRLAIEALGLSLAVVRHWEDAGAVAFTRQAGRRVIDDAAIERLKAVLALRRAGFGVKDIVWLAQDRPPTVAEMRQALAARTAQTLAAREKSIQLASRRASADQAQQRRRA